MLSSVWAVIIEQYRKIVQPTYIPLKSFFTLKKKEKLMECDFIICHGMGWAYCLGGLVEAPLFVCLFVCLFVSHNRILPAWI